MHGNNLSGATAIEIGTTAEFAAGTPTTLGAVRGAGAWLFHRSRATTASISRRMPGHPSGTVVVKVVSLGIAGVGSYTYNTGPTLVFPPRRAVRSMSPTATS